MRLTPQMQVEIGKIRTRVEFMVQQVCAPLEAKMMKRGGYLIRGEDDVIAHAAIAELNPYKVRLENILCETDIKEQAHSYQVRR